MAFVLVQHLAPDHESILSELIRRYTRIEVFEFEDGMKVQPNCAYIIPPNRDMAFATGLGAMRLYGCSEADGLTIVVRRWLLSLFRSLLLHW